MKLWWRCIKCNKLKFGEVMFWEKTQEKPVCETCVVRANLNTIHSITDYLSGTTVSSEQNSWLEEYINKRYKEE